jgi:glycosyltransferase involved in cell wall biosynthesis
MLALQLVRILGAGLGHEVSLLVPRSESPGSAPPSELEFQVERYSTRRREAFQGVLGAAIRGLPLQTGLFHHRDLSRRVRELAPRSDVVILQLTRLADYADDIGDTPFLVDFIDSLALNFEQRAKFDSVWRRPILRFEARRLLAAEADLLGRSVGGLIVSERDRDWLVEHVPRPVADGLAVVPLVNTNRPLPREHEPIPTDGGHRIGRLVFTGNLGYFVNDDAIRWFLGEVWPDLHRARPEIVFTIAGARPRRRLRRLVASAGSGVELLDSPPDLAPFLAAANVSLAPMRAGSGVPVKILEAWAGGIPVVASSWAAAGVSGHHDEDLLIAQTANEWRSAVLRLVDDPVLATNLVSAGRRRLEKHHSEEAARAAIEAALRRAFPRD